MLLVLAGCVSTLDVGDRVPYDWCQHNRQDVQLNTTTSMAGCSDSQGYRGKQPLAYLVENGVVVRQLSNSEAEAIQDDAQCRSYGISSEDERHAECRMNVAQLRMQQFLQDATERAESSRSTAAWLEAISRPATGCTPGNTANCR